MFLFRPDQESWPDRAIKQIPSGGFSKTKSFYLGLRCIAVVIEELQRTNSTASEISTSRSGGHDSNRGVKQS